MIPVGSCRYPPDWQDRILPRCVTHDSNRCPHPPYREQTRWHITRSVLMGRKALCGHVHRRGDGWWWWANLQLERKEGNPRVHERPVCRECDAIADPSGPRQLGLW